LCDIVNPVVFEAGSPRLYPCHRLDRDTSGAIVFAKGKKNQKVMMDVFKNRQIKKMYLAIVHGILKKKSGQIKSIIKDFDQKKYHQRSKGRWAQTDYRVIGEGEGFSFVEIDLKTGRTNQIRIHFSEMGHPLIGERKYAFAKDFLLKFRRPALHAQKIEYVHPITKNNILVEAPLAQDMKDFLSKHVYQGV